jgi:hypothetical protein
VTRVGVHRRSRRYHQGVAVVNFIYVKFDLMLLMFFNCFFF